jgi:hypothetical protein
MYVLLVYLKAILAANNDDISEAKYILALQITAINAPVQISSDDIEPNCFRDI